MTPTFSIIMTSFNYASYVGSAIESVLAQTLEDWELLVVDDCSTDDSWQVITGFTDPRIKAFRQVVNSGACAAYNLALSKAQGRYIACLDSDDIFMPTKLEKQAAFFAAHPDVGICGSFVSEIDDAGQAVAGSSSYADWFNTTLDLNDPCSWLWANHLCHSGAVVRSAVHQQIGDFDKHLVYTPDWQFWLRSLVQGARFQLIEEPLVGYRNHGSNITHKNRPAMVLEHAATSASVLLPWLEQIGRIDLLEDVIEGFLKHPALNDDAQLLEKVYGQFNHSSAVSLTGSIQFRLTQKILNELRTDKVWLATQLATQEEQTNQQLREIKRADKAWMAAELATHYEQSEQLRRENEWLQSQLENYKRLTQTQLSELLAVKSWMGTQFESKEKIIQELYSLLAEANKTVDQVSHELVEMRSKKLFRLERLIRRWVHK